MYKIYNGNLVLMFVCNTVDFMAGICQRVLFTTRGVWVPYKFAS